MDERIQRINELYHKSKAEGLTEEEKDEQARLRREYVESVRRNLKAQLDHIRIEQPEKGLLRRTVLQEREKMDAASRENAARTLAERILSHEWYCGAETVLAFASYGSEIDTDEILRETLRLEKKLFLPRVEGNSLYFHRVRDLSELEGGYKGIREPSADAELFAYQAQEAENVFMLMPGVAFDRACGRMGYGRGFYDRFLADKPDLQRRTVGVGYLCQLVEHVPCEERDIRPCQVICV